MYGLFGTIGEQVHWDFSGFKRLDLTHRELSEERFNVHQITLPKFLNDKYFYDNGECFIATEGVLFEADSPQKAIERYQQGDEFFWKDWRGSFCGVLYDRTKDVLLLFNDHIGSKMLFYATLPSGIVFGSDLYTIAKAIGSLPDNNAFAWQLLIYGYALRGDTIYSSIRRIEAGHFIRREGDQVSYDIYHRFDNTPNTLSIEENIDRLNTAFRRAVERAVRKNEEYGYTHFLPLSAGLDSRMTNRVAHEIAATPIHNITYSQSGFYDETTPHQLAQYWHHQWHFTPLDGGECLKELDEVSRITCGLIHYSGAAETLYGLPDLAKKEAGVFLTGMVGDIIVGTAYTERNPHQTYHMGDGAIVHKWINEMAENVELADFDRLYDNREIYYLYVRGFSCANLGSPLIHQAYGESFSPFCDVDVIETAYAAPLEQRWQNRMYDQWIKTYYPDMLQWLHNGIYKIGQRPKVISLFGRAIAWNQVPKRILWYILKKAHIRDYYKEEEGNSMNPEDSWFEKNESLSDWANLYVNANIGELSSFPRLYEIALALYKGTAMEKMQVLTLLACLRQTHAVMNTNDAVIAP